MAKLPRKKPAPPPQKRTRVTRTTRVAWAIAIVSVVLFAVVAGSERLSQHTSFNHYALLADAWLHGRQDLANGPPAYTMNNDFAQYGGKTFISFPPFPAAVMLPFVAIAGGPERFCDGLFIVCVAGLGPMLLFLVLEKLRATGKSLRSERDNIVLALLFAFGTSYFFTAVDGTVWFAAHIVAVVACGAYIFFALDAERPLLAGVALACAWTTRPGLLLAAPLFLLEALRVASAAKPGTNDSILEQFRQRLSRVDGPRFIKMCALFAIPLIISFAIASWMNSSRFDNASPFAFGHEHLAIRWHGRIERWGLFGYHYLSKNLGIVLANLPWFRPGDVASGPPFQINEHGLALWFTTPIYLWVLWPKKFDFLYATFALCAILCASLDLLYQNSGWRQFGYRFSNDYALFLFVLLAIGARPFGRFFQAAGAWAVAWNLFGAMTFDNPKYNAFYYREGTQSVVFQPD